MLSKGSRGEVYPAITWKRKTDQGKFDSGTCRCLGENVPVYILKKKQKGQGFRLPHKSGKGTSGFGGGNWEKGGLGVHEMGIKKRKKDESAIVVKQGKV